MSFVVLAVDLPDETMQHDLNRHLAVLCESWGPWERWGGGPLSVRSFDPSAIGTMAGSAEFTIDHSAIVEQGPVFFVERQYLWGRVNGPPTRCHRLHRFEKLGLTVALSTESPLPALRFQISGMTSFRGVLDYSSFPSDVR